MTGGVFNLLRDRLIAVGDCTMSTSSLCLSRRVSVPAVIGRRSICVTAQGQEAKEQYETGESLIYYEESSLLFCCCKSFTLFWVLLVVLA